LYFSCIKKPILVSSILKRRKHNEAGKFIMDSRKELLTN
jgi:hypothetical protein